MINDPEDEDKYNGAEYRNMSSMRGTRDMLCAIVAPTSNASIVKGKAASAIIMKTIQERTHPEASSERISPLSVYSAIWQMLHARHR